MAPKLPSFLTDIADACSNILESSLAFCNRYIRKTVVQDISWVLILIALGVYSIFNGFDLSRFVTADALYPVQMLDFSLLSYRPPPSNNLFPDVALHAIVNIFTTDALVQKLIVGWILLALTVICIGITRGATAALVVGGMLFLVGFGAVDSTSHYTLPLMVLAFQLTRHRGLQNIVLLLIVFSDLLVLLPLSVLVLKNGGEDRLLERLAIIVLAGTANVLHSEFSPVLPKLVVAVGVIWTGALIARFFKLERVMSFGVIAALAVVCALGLLEVRYAVPVAASFALILFEKQSNTFNWRYIAIPAVALGIFTFTADPSRLNAFTAQFDCLLDELAEQKIETITTDHWVSKPLYFAAKAKGQKLHIVQIDYEDRAQSDWMAPLSFLKGQSLYGVKSHTMCDDLSLAAPFCIQEEFAEVASSQLLCDGLEFFTYNQIVPNNKTTVPGNKFEAIGYNLNNYLGKYGLSF